MIAFVFFVKYATTSFVFAYEVPRNEEIADVYLAVCRWMYFSACFLFTQVTLFSSHWAQLWGLWVPLYLL